MGEAMSLGAMMVNAGYADHVLSMASSHFATAEKQFRFPLAYGNQRPMSSTWTVTGCGAVVIGKEGQPGLAKDHGIYCRKSDRYWSQRFYEYGSCHGSGGISYNRTESGGSWNG